VLILGVALVHLTPIGKLVEAIDVPVAHDGPTGPDQSARCRRSTSSSRLAAREPSPACLCKARGRPYRRISLRSGTWGVSRAPSCDGALPFNR
jgi:hypothetical protein